MGWASRATAQGAKIQEALIHHWNNLKYGASKLGLPYAKEFLRKFSAIWALVLIKFLQPCCPKPKKCKEYRF
jgi:hypothetical protein